jgi:hypothetical protein
MICKTIIYNIRTQIKGLIAKGQEPSYIILDGNTWNKLRSDIRNIRDDVWFSEEQHNPYSADKIRGLDVAILTGNSGSVIKVVSCGQDL